MIKFDLNKFLLNKIFALYLEQFFVYRSIIRTPSILIQIYTLSMCQVEIWIRNRNLDQKSKFGSEQNFGSEIKIWIKNWIKFF